VDQFCDRLRDQLNAIEGRLQSVKADMQAIPAQAEKGLRAKLEEARSRLRAQQEHIDQTRTNFKAWAEQKVAETKQAVEQWKAKREVKKLAGRADRAEAYAAAAIVIAAATIDEAEAAIFEAVLARREADMAQQPAAPVH
jgi:hypothetical protein